MEPLISVLIAAHNSAPWLGDCLDSVRSQTYGRLQIIVVNDGSTDETGAILDRYAAEDARILPIHQENRGLVAAREAGIAAAKGDFVGFVDSDDQIEPDMYERLLTNALKYDADIAHCGMVFVHPDGREEPHHGTGEILIHDKTEGLRELLTGQRVEPSLCNKLYAARLLPDSCPDTSIVHNEDLLRNFILFSRAERSVFEDFCGYRYTQHPASMSAAPAGAAERYRDIIRARRLILDESPKEIAPCAMRLWLSAHINALNRIPHPRDAEEKAFCQACRRTLHRERKNLRFLIPRQQLAAWLILYAPRLHRILYQLYRGRDEL